MNKINNNNIQGMLKHVFIFVLAIVIERNLRIE